MQHITSLSNLVPPTKERGLHWTRKDTRAVYKSVSSFILMVQCLSKRASFYAHFHLTFHWRPKIIAFIRVSRTRRLIGIVIWRHSNFQATYLSR